ncbi:hypothetical protein Lepto7376_3576 [[Leptolyngbya] sp. PCC 7376]|nr:hypothetical protein Lepto7376_3576 [[Leptolyngbya] sp. PCC 7376]
MSSLPNLKYMPRQILLFSTIALICMGIANAPVQSEESQGNGSGRDGYPEKVVPGGTYFY